MTANFPNALSFSFPSQPSLQEICVFYLHGSIVCEKKIQLSQFQFYITKYDRGVSCYHKEIRLIQSLMFKFCNFELYTEVKIL